MAFHTVTPTAVQGGCSRHEENHVSRDRGVDTQFPQNALIFS